MSKSISEIALIAAEWWADAIEQPKFDNGDKTFPGIFASLLANDLKKPVSPEQKSLFTAELTDQIERFFEENPTLNQTTLSCDYGPCLRLSEISDAVDISRNNFPWKTTMWIARDSVSVGAGYRAPIEYLYASANYWKAAIKRLEENLLEYQNGTMISLTWYEEGEERESIKVKRMAELEEMLKEYRVKLAKAEELDHV